MMYLILTPLVVVTVELGEDGKSFAAEVEGKEEGGGDGPRGLLLLFDSRIRSQIFKEAACFFMANLALGCNLSVAFNSRQ